MSDRQKSERPAATGRNANQHADAAIFTEVLDGRKQCAPADSGKPPRLSDHLAQATTDEQRAEAIEILRRPLQDREREFFHHVGGALLIDDGGGMPIECFDDITAVHFFLQWLDDSREQRAARFEVERRRASITLVGGQEVPQ